MTQDQITRLMDLQKLYEEGILNKDDLAKEKAKILGVKKQVDKVIPENHEDTRVPASNSVAPEPMDSSTPSVTLSKKIPTSAHISETKPKVEDQVLRSEIEPKETSISNQTKKLIENKEVVSASTDISEKQTDGNSKSVFQKFKIPIIIVAGLLVLFIAFNVAKRFKYSSDFYSGYQTENTDYSFEDNYEKLWTIGSTRDYTEDDLRGWSKDDLSILRNYYFARNNFYFGTKDLRDYFSKYSWYQPLNKEVGDWFSDLQINNVQYIKKLEGLPNYYKQP